MQANAVAAYHKSSWQHFEVEHQIKTLLNLQEEANSHEELKVEDSRINSKSPAKGEYVEEEKLSPNRQQLSPESNKKQVRKRQKPAQ